MRRSAGLAAGLVVLLSMLSAQVAASASGTGTAWGWGSNYQGQTGTGTITPGGVLTPTQPIGDLQFTQIAPDISHVCGLTTDGTAYCWGDNPFGELGNGTVSGIEDAPVQVLTPVRFTQITSGKNHTCAIDGDKVAWCWGHNDNGQVGNPAAASSQVTPIQVDTPVRFTQLSAMDFATCGLAVDQTAYCWGAGASGRLGYGGTGSAPTPVQVGGGSAPSFIQISTGAAFACGLQGSGRVQCWGENSFDQLGYSTGGTGYSTLPQLTTAVTNYSFIASGGYHTCGLRASGAAQCWGANGSGELGIGALVPVSTPTPQDIPGVTFKDLASGLSSSCGVLTDGTVSCWGSNGFGQLGDGTTDNRTSPTPTVGGLTVARVWGGSEAEVSFATVALPDAAPLPQVFDLSLLGAGPSQARCTNVQAAGTLNSWVRLPSASQCTRVGANAPTGSVLLGWSTSAAFPIALAQRQVDMGWGTFDGPVNGQRMIFIPAGRYALISGNGSLFPVWDR